MSTNSHTQKLLANVLVCKAQEVRAKLAPAWRCKPTNQTPLQIRQQCTPDLGCTCFYIFFNNLNCLRFLLTTANSSRAKVTYSS